MNARKRILFADDDPNVLQGLQRMLRPMRHDWDMTFAPGGREACALLDGEPFDVVMSDMRMPEVSGAQLLKEVMRRHPRTVRIILTGQSDEENLLRAVEVAHQYLAKPCESETLKATVARACRLRDLLGNERLQQIISQITALPSDEQSFDAVRGYLGLVAVEGELPESISDLAAEDVAMSAKALQLVNSAFFGYRRSVVSPAVAAQMIGPDSFRTLVESTGAFVKAESSVLAQYVNELNRHSRLTRELAARIAEVEGMDSTATECVCGAAMLHDIGKLALVSGAAEVYQPVHQQISRGDSREIEVEREALGATHAEVGAYLAALWGLPDPVVEIIANHHTAGLDPEDSDVGLQTAVVQAANVLARRIEKRAKTERPPAAAETLSLSGKSINRRIPAWREFCLASTRPRSPLKTTRIASIEPVLVTPERLNARTPV